MTAARTYLWAVAAMAVAILTILEVLPDWTAIAVVLTAPFVLSTRGCASRGGAR